MARGHVHNNLWWWIWDPGVRRNAERLVRRRTSRSMDIPLVLPRRNRWCGRGLVGPAEPGQALWAIGT